MSRALIVLCILAAVGPSRMVVSRINARAVAKTITQFGPLPEIQITSMEWLLGVSAGILLVAAAMELMRRPIAAPTALLATMMLWTFFGPGIWAHVTGDGFFEPFRTGYSTAVPWQQCVYQTGATVCAAFLTYIRYWARV